MGDVEVSNNTVLHWANAAYSSRCFAVHFFGYHVILTRQDSGCKYADHVRVFPDRACAGDALHPQHVAQDTPVTCLADGDHAEWPFAFNAIHAWPVTGRLPWIH